MRLIFAIAVWLGATLGAFAQSPPSPAFYQNFKPTPAQWNSFFTAKQDYLGFTPFNVTGGVLQGRLVTAAAGASLAGFNLPPGSIPGAPANGDLWVTASGVFARVNGSTITLGGAAPSIGAATIKGNPAATGAVESAFTVQGLTARGSPDANNDQLLIFDNAAGTLKKVTPGQVAASATAGVSSIAGNTGPFTLGNGLANTVNSIRFADIAADGFWMNGTGSTAAPTVKTFPSCSGATNGLQYNIATHLLGCATFGTVLSISITPGVGITQSGSPVTGSGSIVVNIDKSTAANIWAADADKVLTADGASAAAALVALSGTSSVTPNFGAGFNFTFQVTSATNFTLQNPTGQKAGQTGCIYITQPGSGTPVTITYGSQWFTPGGVATAPLASALGNVTRLCYFVVTPNSLIDFSVASQALAH